MAIGTVIWFNPTKRYGFIGPDDGSKDVFVHMSDVEEAGLPALTQGQKVSFTLSDDPNGKPKAVEISVVE